MQRTPHYGPSWFLLRHGQHGRVSPCQLSFGPCYIIWLTPCSKVVADEDKKALETISNSIIKEKQPFERLEMTKDELLEMFQYSKYKVYFINQRVPEGTKSTVYRCGPLIDLCRGPHVPHTGNIKAFSVLKVGKSPDSPSQTMVV